MDELTEEDLLSVFEALGFDADNSEESLQVMRQMGGFEIVESSLAELGIPAADVKEGLDADQVFRLKLRYSELDSLRYVHPESKIPAIAILDSIEGHSKRLLYPAKAANMEAQWAKEYCNGYFAQYKMQVTKALESGETATSAGAGKFDQEGRPYYYRIVEVGSLIGDCWRRLPKALDESASKEGIAQDTYDAYDKALDQYWSLLDKFVTGLGQEGVVTWVGDIFRKMLETHRKLFKECSPKILATVKPLGGETVKKVEEWTAKTDEKLAAALKAASG